MNFARLVRMERNWDAENNYSEEMCMLSERIKYYKKQIALETACIKKHDTALEERIEYIHEWKVASEIESKLELILTQVLDVKNSYSIMHKNAPLLGALDSLHDLCSCARKPEADFVEYMFAESPVHLSVDSATIDMVANIHNLTSARKAESVLIAKLECVRNTKLAVEILIHNSYLSFEEELANILAQCA